MVYGCLSVKQRIVAIAIAFVVIVAIGLLNGDDASKVEPTPTPTSTNEAVDPVQSSEISVIGNSDNDSTSSSDSSTNCETYSYDLKETPSYSGDQYAVVNDNVPFFTESELANAVTSYESYSRLDSFGRCGSAIASVGIDIMSTEDRESISEVTPSRWEQASYDGVVDGGYLYNRSHLIGFQLTGENANARNLTTGTRQFNTEGMLPFENMVADYVKETGNHVLYRVTPDFKVNT